MLGWSGLCDRLLGMLMATNIRMHDHLDHHTNVNVTALQVHCYTKTFICSSWSHHGHI